jgi:hypothetical protein
MQPKQHIINVIIKEYRIIIVLKNIKINIDNKNITNKNISAFIIIKPGLLYKNKNDVTKMKIDNIR